MDFNWDFTLISQSDNFEIKWVAEFPNADWDWEYISENYNFDISWLKKYPNKNWNYEIIISNYDYLPLEIFDLIDEKYLSYQGSKFSYYESFENKCRQYMAVYKIQQWWKKILYNPRHIVGKTYVAKLYDKNFENESSIKNM